MLVLSPILSDVADDFGVSIATAGQLRIVAAPLAAAVALLAARSLVRFSPRALLGAGSALVSLGSVASALAPSFAALVLAQVPLWAGISLLLTAAIAASAAWSTPESRTRVVASMYAGPPAAWIVGMPLIGVVAEVDWRLAFLVLPLPAALLAGLAAAGRPHDAPLAATGTSLRDLLRRPAPRRWALGELLATSAWAGTLVYSGALLTDGYGMTTTATGVALAAVAVAYLLGNQRAGRGSPDRARSTMLATSVVGAAAVVLTWAFTPAVAVTLVVFAISGAMVATRTVVATVYGFSVAGNLGREVAAARAVTTQLGYLVGSLAGGAAFALGGFPALAVAFGGLLLASTLPYVSLRSGRRPVLATAAAAGTPETAAEHPPTMPTRYVPLRRGSGLVIRPLRNGDVETVTAVFERLGETSRRMRFNGPKPRLSDLELDAPRDGRRDAARPRRVPPRTCPSDRDRAARAGRVECRDRVRGGGRAPEARDRVGAHRRARRRRARRGNHRGHGTRREREHGCGLPAPASARTARRPVRGDGAIGARSARLSRPPVRRGASSRRAPR